MRTGQDYIRALVDDRSVFVDGQRVKRVNEHEAFAGVVRSVAALYDFAADPANDMRSTSPDTGHLANKAFMIPRSADDLRQRNVAMGKWAALSSGFMTRTPDHVAAYLAGFASAPEVFERARQGAGDNVQRFYRRVLDEDLYVSFLVIPPQIGRLEPAYDREEDFVQVGVHSERADGIVVRGAQMLGTAAVLSDYLLVSCLKPLQPGDEKYAVSFVVPLAAAGITLSCRRPYAVGAPSVFDYPLSTRFDESDALVIFDDVFVPWADVFVYRDVAATASQWDETPAHLLGSSQAQLRLTIKLKFILGVARKVASLNDLERIPIIQEKLGSLASLAALVEGMGIAAETRSDKDANGIVRPGARFTYGAMALIPDLYARALHLLRELLGTTVLQVPASYRDLVGEETKDLVAGYVGSAGDPRSERVKLLKLAWDIVGSEFAGRHYQYEMFQAGAPFVASGYSHRNYGYDEPVALVDEFLAGYRLPDAEDGFVGSLPPSDHSTTVLT